MAHAVRTDTVLTRESGLRTKRLKASVAAPLHSSWCLKSSFSEASTIQLSCFFSLRLPRLTENEQDPESFCTLKAPNSTMPPTAKPRAAEIQGSVLPLIVPTSFYTPAPKKRPGPTRLPIAETALTFTSLVKNPDRSYMSFYKVRVISYWHHPEIICEPTVQSIRRPTHAEVSFRFKIPETNISRWKRQESTLRNAISTQRRFEVNECLRQ